MDNAIKGKYQDKSSGWRVGYTRGEEAAEELTYAQLLQRKQDHDSEIAGHANDDYELGFAQALSDCLAAKVNPVPPSMQRMDNGIIPGNEDKPWPLPVHSKEALLNAMDDHIMRGSHSEADLYALHGRLLAWANEIKRQQLENVKKW